MCLFTIQRGKFPSGGLAAALRRGQGIAYRVVAGLERQAIRGACSHGQLLAAGQCTRGADAICGVPAAACNRQRGRDGEGVGAGGISSRRSVAIYLNLFYTFRLACQNGCAIYSRRFVPFRSFHYKWGFAVCSSTIGIVVEYTFGDGISFGRGDGGLPTVSPPSPIG